MKDTLDLASRCLAYQDLAKEKILLDIANSLAARLESHRLKRESHGSSLKELLHDCRDSLCTDQRDKIYALVGLASDCQDGQVVIDYSKSLAQVYKDVMKLYSLHAKPVPLAAVTGLVTGVVGLRLAGDAVLDLWQRGDAAGGDRAG